MKKIKELADKICDELEGSKEYAEESITQKVKGNGTRATQFRAMAQEELNHANILHDIAVSEISEISKVVTPPTEMEEEWEKAHKKFLEKAAWIKQMLAM